MSGYDGRDVRDDFDHDDAPGIPDDDLPVGWARFDPADGEGDGDEAYLFANGHQVLITEGVDSNFYVLAYPGHGMTDLCGFVRPLRDISAPGQGGLPRADSLGDARQFALGYMTAVRYYEGESTDATVFPEQ